jgi:hypothetical protein
MRATELRTFLCLLIACIFRNILFGANSSHSYGARLVSIVSVALNTITMFLSFIIRVALVYISVVHIPTRLMTTINLSGPTADMQGRMMSGSLRCTLQSRAPRSVSSHCMPHKPQNHRQPSMPHGSCERKRRQQNTTDNNSLVALPPANDSEPETSP